MNNISLCANKKKKICISYYNMYTFEQSNMFLF